MVVEGGTCTLTIFSVEVDNTIALKSKILRYIYIYIFFFFLGPEKTNNQSVTRFQEA